MKISIKSTIDYFSKKPGNLFLLDGLGAAVTTCSLFFVLRNYYNYFGMPTNILTYLSIIGLVYSAYSMSCYFLIKHYRAPYLRILGTGNLLYCFLTITLVITQYAGLTGAGLTYFLAEIFIILLLACMELSVAKKLKAAYN